jgi:hypothetical protein
MKKTIYYLTLFTCILFSSCGVNKDLVFKTNEKVIPQDFGKKKSTILVVKYGKRNIDKYINKGFEQNYQGDFVVIDIDELYNNKYKDFSKYRYEFSLIDDYRGGSTIAGQRQSQEFNYNAQLIDRETGKFYKTFKSTNMYGDLVAAYAKQLNEIRIQNEK